MMYTTVGNKVFHWVIKLLRHHENKVGNFTNLNLCMYKGWNAYLNISRLYGSVIRGFFLNMLVLGVFCRL
jgi:hypothetical protein